MHLCQKKKKERNGRWDTHFLLFSVSHPPFSLIIVRLCTEFVHELVV